MFIPSGTDTKLLNKNLIKDPASFARREGKTYTLIVKMVNRILDDECPSKKKMWLFITQNPKEAIVLAERFLSETKNKFLVCKYSNEIQINNTTIRFVIPEWDRYFFRGINVEIIFIDVLTPILIIKEMILRGFPYLRTIIC